MKLWERIVSAVFCVLAMAAIIAGGAAGLWLVCQQTPEEPVAVETAAPRAEVKK